MLASYCQAWQKVPSNIEIFKQGARAASATGPLQLSNRSIHAPAAMYPITVRPPDALHAWNLRACEALKSVPAPDWCGPGGQTPLDPCDAVRLPCARRPRARSCSDMRRGKPAASRSTWSCPVGTVAVAVDCGWLVREDGLFKTRYGRRGAKRAEKSRNVGVVRRQNSHAFVYEPEEDACQGLKSRVQLKT